jgi:hypothetical protein
MNSDHVQACFAGAPVFAAELNGVTLVSNGYIAVQAWTNSRSPLLGPARPMPKLAEIWGAALRVDVSPLPIGNTCHGTEQTISRQIGERWVRERHVRCFGPDVTWTLSPDNAEMLLVHSGGELIGIATSSAQKPHGPLYSGLTDRQVFGPMACAENGWYLLAAEDLAERIASTERDISRAEREREEAESELDEYAAELRSLRARLNAMAPKGAHV